MDWSAPFIVYRVSAEGKLEEVFHADDLKKAKYWLTYIAQPGDVLTRTPAHPRHSDGRPTYWSHKEESGTPSSKKEDWEKFAKTRIQEVQFPEEQLSESVVE